ncbi:MAG: hypothetical protein Q8R31_07070 [Candidatus Omnitrophota bacterium]|nr:hypothetical protein [Candidatus Omnitrophota bacterium]
MGPITKDKIRFKGIAFGNIPLFNLIGEVAFYYNAFSDKSFVGQIFQERYTEPIKYKWLFWTKMPGELVAYILQRMFLCFESFLYCACFYYAGTQHKMDLLHKRFTLGKGAVNSIYKRLPEELNIKSLYAYNAKLYDDVGKLYKEIRNPLFHGYTISGYTKEGLREIFELFSLMYKWVSEWIEFGKDNVGIKKIINEEFLTDKFV